MEFLAVTLFKIQGESLLVGAAAAHVIAALRSHSVAPVFLSMKERQLDLSLTLGN